MNEDEYDWRDGRYACAICGLVRTLCGSIACATGHKHTIIWLPLPNPEFDTPEAQHTMRQLRDE